MLIRLGYVAITNALDVTSSSAFTYTEFSKNNDFEKLDKIIKSNFEDLIKILKYNGNVKLAVTEGEIPDWEDITKALVDNTKDETDNVEKYQLK